MQRESSLLLGTLLLGTLLLGTLLLRRKVYKSKVWVPERIHPREQWMPLLAVYLTLMVHFNMSMSIRDVMTEKFSPQLFLYSLFHYPKLFLYFSEGPKTFSLFAISLHKTFSLFSEGPKTFSLFFFSICYFITHNFFSILREALNFFSILRKAQDFFSIPYLITQNFFSILKRAQNFFSILFLYLLFHYP